MSFCGKYFFSNYTADLKAMSIYVNHVNNNIVSNKPEKMNLKIFFFCLTDGISERKKNMG